MYYIIRANKFFLPEQIPGDSQIRAQMNYALPCESGALLKTALNFNERHFNIHHHHHLFFKRPKQKHHMKAEIQLPVPLKRFPDSSVSSSI